MNNKAKGSRRERQAKKIMEQAGYYVNKAGGSLGQFDLVCLGKKQARLIQVKSNYMSPAEREEIELFDEPDYAVKEIWIFKDYKREPKIEVIK